MRSMGLPFAQNMHGGPDFRHILRKFTGLKEGVGENIPNTGRVIVSARQFMMVAPVFVVLIIQRQPQRDRLHVRS